MTVKTLISKIEHNEHNIQTLSSEVDENGELSPETSDKLSECLAKRQVGVQGLYDHLTRLEVGERLAKQKIKELQDIIGNIEDQRLLADKFFDEYYGETGTELTDYDIKKLDNEFLNSIAQQAVKVKTASLRIVVAKDLKSVQDRYISLLNQELQEAQQELFDTLQKARLKSIDFGAVAASINKKPARVEVDKNYLTDEVLLKYCKKYPDYFKEEHTAKPDRKALLKAMQEDGLVLEGFSVIKDQTTLKVS